MHFWWEELVEITLAMLCCGRKKVIVLKRDLISDNFSQAYIIVITVIRA